MTDTTAGEALTDIFEKPFDFDDPRIEVARVLSRTEAKAVLEFSGDIVKALAAQPSAGARVEAPFAYAFRYIFEGDLRPTAWSFQKRPKEAREPVAGQHSGVEVVPLYATPAQPDTGEVAALREVADHASTVMRYLEEDGASIVAHLMDTDDNPGQRLRDAIALATQKAERA